jgi:hypothetical protein
MHRLQQPLDLPTLRRAHATVHGARTCISARAAILCVDARWYDMRVRAVGDCSRCGDSIASDVVEEYGVWRRAESATRRQWNALIRAGG